MNLTDIHSHTTTATDSNGIKHLLTVVCIISTEFILVNDSFAKYRGYMNRGELIHCNQWQAYSSTEMYFDLSTGRVYTMQELMPLCLN